jgi:hypothetical protein
VFGFIKVSLVVHVRFDLCLFNDDHLRLAGLSSTYTIMVNSSESRYTFAYYCSGESRVCPVIEDEQADDRDDRGDI